MKKKIIGGPLNGLPISNAIEVDGLLFLCGQVGADPVTGEPAGMDITAQTKKALENVKSLLTQAGSGMEKVVSVQIFLCDRQDFAAMNEVYKAFFTKDPPCRTTVQAAIIDPRYKIEITVIAHK